MQSKLRVLLVDDERIVCLAIGRYLRKLGHSVDEATSGLDAFRMVQSHDYDLLLTDVVMPGMDGMDLLKRVREARPETSVVLITGHGVLQMVIQALRMGAVDFLQKPIKLGDLDAVLEKSSQIRRLRQDGRHLRETISGLRAVDQLRAGKENLIGASDAIRGVHRQIQQVVDADARVVLITGETGTGKEVAARDIHGRAAPGDAPFVAICCPALPESLAESELFGHVRGAFTGATTDRAGCFELSDGGTLFLDEIADLTGGIQAKMLRVLETQTLRRVGSSKELRVNVRVIAATNARLPELVATGQFRRDLFYRLNAYEIILPPLRDRPDDIIPLAAHFVRTYSASRHLPCQGICPEAEGALVAYDFPGNVRELRNLVERAAFLCGAGPIRPDHLAIPQRRAGIVRAQSVSPGREDERASLLRALEAAHWNRRRLAETVGIPYSTLLYRMRRLGIEGR